MYEPHAERQRAAARDALAARTRALTGAALTVSALLSAAFAGLAAASAPGKQLRSRIASRTPAQVRRPARRGTAIPTLPAPSGPGDVGAPPPAPTPAPAAPAPATAPPVVVSGGS